MQRLQPGPEKPHSFLALNSHLPQLHQLRHTISRAFVEVISTHPLQPRVYVLYIYASPSVVFTQSRRSHEAALTAKGHLLLLPGDFNDPNKPWDTRLPRRKERLSDAPPKIISGPAKWRFNDHPYRLQCRA